MDLLYERVLLHDPARLGVRDGSNAALLLVLSIWQQPNLALSA